MQVTVEIPDDLARQITDRGDSPEAFVEELLKQPPVQAHSDPAPRLDLEIFFKRMAQFSDKIPQLPDEAFTRESFYQDHD